MTPGRRNRPIGRRSRAAAFLIASLLAAPPAVAAPIANSVASFSGLDKITARLTSFDVYIGETVQFGSLQITPRACYTAAPNEPPKTVTFVEVDQVNLHGGSKRIFTGWMFADSPALNAIDDAVYDFWLVDCAQHSDVPPPTQTNPEPKPPVGTPAPAPAAQAAAPAAAPSQPTLTAAPTDGSSIQTLSRPATTP